MALTVSAVPTEATHNEGKTTLPHKNQRAISKRRSNGCREVTKYRIPLIPGIQDKCSFIQTLCPFCHEIIHGLEQVIAFTLEVWRYPFPLLENLWRIKIQHSQRPRPQGGRVEDTKSRGTKQRHSRPTCPQPGPAAGHQHVSLAETS